MKPRYRHSEASAVSVRRWLFWKRLGFLAAAAVLGAMPGCRGRVHDFTGTGRAVNRQSLSVEEENGEYPLPSFTPEQSARLEEIRAAGGLKVATREWPGGIEAAGKGAYTGFHHRLLEEACRILDLSIEYHFVEFNDFFSIDGVIPPDVKTSPSVSYTPDIFQVSDIIVYDISVLPWRTKLMDFVPILPARNLVMTRDHHEISQLGDLAGLRGVVFGNSSHEAMLEKLNRNLSLDIEIISRPFGDDIFEDVRSERADFCIRDSNSVIIDIDSSAGLVVSMALGNANENSWAVARGDEALRSVFVEAIAHLTSTGAFQKIFQDAYGIDIEDYYTLMNYRPERQLEFSNSERARLDEIREEGGLRAAIYDEQSVYEVDEYGRAFGLHYNLALAAADLLDIPLQLEPVLFSDFFYRDGVVDERLKTDPGFSYKPDLLNRVHLYVSTITRLPWREKIFLFIDVYPTKIVYIVRSGSPRPDVDSTAGKTFSVLADSSFETWMNENLPVERIRTVVTTHGREQMRLVSDGEADITLDDANIALTRVDEFPNLVFYPTEAETDMLAWAVSREDEQLQSILTKVVAYLKEDRTFETVWRSYYDIGFEEYLGILSLQD